ncbi:MAG: LURP-one-related/scramblase family protein [Oscillospiraceae bacterium]
MKLLFKQRFLSWFDSYDIYDEMGNVVFTVEGKLSWGHRLEIYDAMRNNIATVKEEVFTFLPRCILYVGGRQIGEIQKEFTFFKPSYRLNCNDWHVQGDILGWNYQVVNSYGYLIMQADKQILNWTDTYVIDTPDPANLLMSLMIVLAIDIANCR